VASVKGLLYEAAVSFTKVTEFGVSMESIVAGQIAPPPEGARFDIAFDGGITGEMLKGHISGVDYLNIRADGRIELHIHADITTEDNEKISFFADGICVANPEQGPGIFDLRENGTLTTSSPAYAWLNQVQIWGSGTVDAVRGQVTVKAYSA
jgi:hypothetical protein